MYVFDTSAFVTLGFYYPERFPSIWKKLDKLVLEKKLWSVREARKELENYCPSPYVEEWVTARRDIFKKPSTEEEFRIISEIFRRPHFRELVKRQNLLKGWPVADPFVVASAKVHNASVVTQEEYIKNAPRIPTVCVEFGINCINMEQFLKKENLKF